MSFESDFSFQRQRLSPLFSEAVDADCQFHSAWDVETKTSGVKQYKQTEEYSQLLKRFQAAKLAIDQVVAEAIDAVKQGDSEHLPTLIAYLDLPGRYFRSGYTRKTIWRLFKNASLDDAHRKILRRIFLQNVVSAGPEFAEAIKLAPILADKEFILGVEGFRESKSEYVAERARKILAKLELMQ